MADVLNYILCFCLLSFTALQTEAVGGNFIFT